MSVQSLVFLPLTFGIYIASAKLQKRTGWILLNPILITIASLILVLKLTGTDYATYNESGRYIEFWLKPAIVALGIPLYKYLEIIRKQFLPIFLCQLIGSAVGIMSVVAIARWLGAGEEVVLSLAAKSVTTPIAIEITSEIGGIPALTSSVVILTGIFGAVVGLRFLKFIHTFPHNAQGISIGTAAHGIGTAQMFLINPSLGTFSTLGLILNGIFTSLLTPRLLMLMDFLG